MDELLQFVREANAKITKSNSANPQLVIIGEEHHFDTLLDPEPFFTTLQPVYFFCEAIPQGEELDFKRYTALVDTLPEEIEDHSFENIIQHAQSPFGLGYTVKAINEWFRKSTRTVFVGMDIPDLKERGESIIAIGNGLIEQIDDYLDNMLCNYPHKLSHHEHTLYTQLREWLSHKKHNVRNYKVLERRLGDLRRYIPRRVVENAGVEGRLQEAEQAIEEIDRDRETTMAQTMARYTKRTTKPTQAIAGSGHIQPHSHIFSVLDDYPITYISIDIVLYRKYTPTKNHSDI